jgi:hypothetical protein
MQFEATHDVFVLCGLVDQTVDRMADKRTSLSPALAIRREIVSMIWPLSPDMLAGQDKLAASARDAMLEELRKLKIPQSWVNVVTNKWYEVVLLPKVAKKSDVHSLLDVKSVGGKILSQEGYDAAAISRT